MKTNTLTLLTLPLFAIIAVPGVVAAADPIVSFSTDFPGGNLRVISNDGATADVAPDLRGGRDWFYWCFQATALRPGKVTFRFPEKVAGFLRGAVGFQGPAVSNDGGQTWRWRGSNHDQSSADEFSWDFTAVGQTMRFAVTIPYTRSDFDRFVEQHRGNSHLQLSVLTHTRLDREVPVIQVGHPGDGRRAMLITCRHHACETIASFLFEGVIATAISDSDAGRAFREKYVLYAVPLVDIDGVEAGDQGKNRPPHDHNRDYGEESIYRSVQAIKVLGTEKNIRVLLDLHCPTLVMDIHQRFYFVGPSDMPPQNESVVQQLASFMKSELPAGAPHGPVLQLSPIDKEHHKYCSGYFSTLPGMLMAVTLETPFAPRKAKMSPDEVRSYGAALLRAWNQVTIPTVQAGIDPEAP
ncbi:M14 family zinc carboxypeptidase [Stieleria varia]|uniref:Zinc carboxypeptidase n=1 Tax=Stieleria varia TaxID=2528005 RepID=A0A5C6B358_9BACT|nr:M14 family zinc carboxypeptidase [Stieleria varia]TWU06217.1 Zinc carboxypeptidase [Stieleria varia]